MVTSTSYINDVASAHNQLFGILVKLHIVLTRQDWHEPHWCLKHLLYMFHSSVVKWWAYGNSPIDVHAAPIWNWLWVMLAAHVCSKHTVSSEQWQSFVNIDNTKFGVCRGLEDEWMVDSHKHWPLFKIIPLDPVRCYRVIQIKGPLENMAAERGIREKFSTHVWYRITMAAGSCTPAVNPLDILANLCQVLAA